MNHFISLIKMNMKLLLRNKGFLFFLCVTPILSVCVLNLQIGDSDTEKKKAAVILELEEASERAVYAVEHTTGSTATFIVKVFDASASELSEYMLKGFVQEGMFSVCRYQDTAMTEEEALDQAQLDAFDDRAGVVLYIKDTFDKAVTEGDFKNAVQIYRVSEDKRFEVLEASLKEKLQMMYLISLQTNGDMKQIINVISDMEKAMPGKEIVTISKDMEIAMDERAVSQRGVLGYSFAIVTIGFLFCGVCIAYTVIEEQDNKVYTRILLSKVGRGEYLLAKMTMSLLIVALQTGILAVCMKVLLKADIGIQMGELSFVLFLLGSIFGLFSVCIGVLVGDVMGANVAVFVMWSISSLLSGSYFPLGDNVTMNAISYLMPQRWFLSGVDMLIAGDKSAYSMLIYITVAYVVVILCVGAAGLKIRRVE